MKESIEIRSAQHTYPVWLGEEVWRDPANLNLLKRLAQRFVIITDTQVESLWAQVWRETLRSQQFQVDVLTFPAGEIYKTRETKQQLEDRLFALGCRRDTCLLAVGGGVVLDMTGYLAATYYRGIPVVYVPTTLLSMVDACLGGKTGVNTPFGKNTIGTLTAPTAIFIDVKVLNTLPLAERYQGVAEMLKHALIADAALFQRLKEEVTTCLQGASEVLLPLIAWNCRLKQHIIETDEAGHNLRDILNFGHTFGHAIELLSEYSIPHGIAVAMGLMMESYVSQQRGYLNAQAFTEICTTIRAYPFSFEQPLAASPDTFWQALQHDKKNTVQAVRCVLLDAIGKPHSEAGQYAIPISYDEVVETWRFFETFF